MNRFRCCIAAALTLLSASASLADLTGNEWVNYGSEQSVIDYASVGWSAASERNTIRPESSWAVEDVLLPSAALAVERIEWIGVRDPQYDYDADFIMLGSVADPNSGGYLPDPGNRVTVTDQAWEIEELLLLDADTQIYRGVLDFSSSPIDVVAAHLFLGVRLVGVTGDGSPNDGRNSIAVSSISQSHTVFGGLSQAAFRGVAWGYSEWSPINGLFGTPGDRYELAYRIVFVPEPAGVAGLLVAAAAFGRRVFRG